MTELQSFLLENSVADLTEDIKLTLKRKNKTETHTFKIGTLSSRQHSQFMKKCQSPVKKDGMSMPDMGKFRALVCIHCTIEPNFSDAAFIKALGVETPDESLNKVLRSGEIDDLYMAISNLSGYDSDVDEDVEAAKN